MWDFFQKKEISYGSAGVSNCSRWCVRRRFSKAWVAPGIRGPNCLASIGCVSAWLVEANLLGECLRTGWQGGTGRDVLCWDMGGGGYGGDGGGRGGKFSLDFVRLVALSIVCLLGFWLQRQQEQTEDHKMILADLFVLTATQKKADGDPLAS